MKPEDLVKIWDVPDSSKLTPRQISIRLPLEVSAKISALAELFPRKTKTEIIGDLLAAALNQLEETLPSKKGRLLNSEPREFEEDEEYYEDIGLRGDFLRRAEKNLCELEKELGIDNKNMTLIDPWVSNYNNRSSGIKRTYKAEELMEEIPEKEVKNVRKKKTRS